MGKSRLDKMLTVDTKLYAKFGESLNSLPLFEYEKYLHYIRNIIAKPSDARPISTRPLSEQSVSKLNQISLNTYLLIE